MDSLVSFVIRVDYSWHWDITFFCVWRSNVDFLIINTAFVREDPSLRYGAGPQLVGPRWNIAAMRLAERALVICFIKHVSDC